MKSFRELLAEAREKDVSKKDKTKIYVYDEHSIGYLSGKNNQNFHPLTADPKGLDWKRGPYPYDKKKIRPATLEDAKRLKLNPSSRYEFETSK